MLLIFIIGFLVGMILTMIFKKYVRDDHENEINSLKTQISMLTKQNKDLLEVIENRRIKE